MEEQQELVKGGVAITFYNQAEMSRVLEIKDEFSDILFEDESDIKYNSNFKIDSEFRTIYINGGKNTNLEKGDILGKFNSWNWFK